MCFFLLRRSFRSETAKPLEATKLQTDCPHRQQQEKEELSDVTAARPHVSSAAALLTRCHPSRPLLCTVR